MNITHTDLFSLFETAGRKSQHGITIVNGDDRSYRSYEEILDEASEKSAALAAKDVLPGDRIALFARTSFDFMLGCMACWRLGAVIVPLAFPPKFMSQDGWMRQAEARARSAKVKAILIGDEEERLADDLPHIPIGELRSSSALDGPRVAAGEPAVIQYTSGSTSSPRGVVVNHSTIVSQLDILVEAFNQGREHRPCVSWLPLYHDLGFITMLLYHLGIGAPVTLLPPERFLFDPGSWICEISKSRAHLSAAPAFAYGVAARAIEKGLPESVDLSCWKVAASGGESINPIPVRRFFDSAAPLGFDPGGFCPGYGLAEATCVATVARPGDGLIIDSVDRSALLDGRAEKAAGDGGGHSRFVSCGKPLPRVRVKVVSEGQALEERRLGEIWISGPTLMRGYLGDPEATEKVLDGEWLRTGDIGYLAEGNLYVTGRAKDTVIVRGQNFSPEDLERVVEEVPGTHWGSIAAFGATTQDSESAVFAVETKIKEDSELLHLKSEIQKRLLTETGIVAKDIVLLPPYTLPRTSSGKLQRSTLRAKYEAGELRDIELLAKSDSSSG